MKKSVFLGLSVILLIFGMAFISCGDDSSSGDETSGFIDVELPVSSGVNAVSGKIYYDRSFKTNFSVTTASDNYGTWEMSRIADGKYGDGYKNKYEYFVIGTGTYSWDDNAKTVTLKSEKISIINGNTSYEDGYEEIKNEIYYKLLMNVSELRSYFETELEKQRNEMGNAAFNEALLQDGFSSISAYIDYMLSDIFRNVTYSYSFSNGNTALFLDEVLPAKKGTNELSGQTFYGETWDDNAEKYVKDERITCVFTASGFTYTESWGHWEEVTTGPYSYDSTTNIVWLKKETINGKNRKEIFDAVTLTPHFYPDDYAYRAVEATNKGFYLLTRKYNTSDKTISL